MFKKKNGLLHIILLDAIQISYGFQLGQVQLEVPPDFFQSISHGEFREFNSTLLEEFQERVNRLWAKEGTGDNLAWCGQSIAGIRAESIIKIPGSALKFWQMLLYWLSIRCHNTRSGPIRNNTNTKDLKVNNLY